jgi:rare lipoprotein A
MIIAPGYLKMRLKALLVLSAVLLLVPGRGQQRIRKTNRHSLQYGIASFYANRFNGHRTANGEIFSNRKFTAAHNSLPFGTFIKVTNRRNAKWVIVRVNDRLQFRNRRLVDLTQAAARQLGFHERGLVRVKLQVIPPGMMGYLLLPPELGL